MIRFRRWRDSYRDQEDYDEPKIRSVPIVFKMNQDVETWKGIGEDQGLNYELEPTDEISEKLSALKSLLTPSQTAKLVGLARPPESKIHEDEEIFYPRKVGWFVRGLVSRDSGSSFDQAEGGGQFILTPSQILEAFKEENDPMDHFGRKRGFHTIVSPRDFRRDWAEIEISYRGVIPVKGPIRVVFEIWLPEKDFTEKRNRH